MTTSLVSERKCSLIIFPYLHPAAAGVEALQAPIIPFDLHSLPRLLENGWLLVNLGGLVVLGPGETVGLVNLLPLQVGLWGCGLLVLVVLNLVALVNLGGLVNLVGLWCWGRL